MPPKIQPRLPADLVLSSYLGYLDIGKQQGFWRGFARRFRPDWHIFSGLSPHSFSRAQSQCLEIRQPHCDHEDKA